MASEATTDDSEANTDDSEATSNDSNSNVNSGDSEAKRDDAKAITQFLILESPVVGRRGRKSCGLEPRVTCNAFSGLAGWLPRWAVPPPAP